MNVRKETDYSAMFTALDALMATAIPQMELYCEIGRLVCDRPEKGAAVAAAEYLKTAYPDRSGFSPRNLRRMREFYCTYREVPETLAKAMSIGWTQNVVILEADLTLQEKAWYIQAVKQFGWSKTALLEKIKAEVHWEVVLDIQDKVCYTEENNTEMERTSNDKDTFPVPWEYMSESDVRVRDEGFGEESGTGKQVPHRVRSHQHRGDWQSGLSSGPPQAGRAWHRLHRQNGPSAEESRLRSIRPSDWDGQSQPAKYVPYLRRRLR